MKNTNRTNTIANTDTAEARVLAMLLGESQPDEQAAVAAMLASDPALRAWHDTVNAILPAIREAIRSATTDTRVDTPELHMVLITHPLLATKSRMDIPLSPLCATLDM